LSKPSSALFAAPPAFGLAELFHFSGGQKLAHEPVHVTWRCWSFMKTYSVRPFVLTSTTPRPLIVRVFTATELVECCAPRTLPFGAEDADEPEYREQRNHEQANLVSVGIAAQDPHIHLPLLGRSYS
jgi:hypothetical protein